MGFYEDKEAAEEAIAAYAQSHFFYSYPNCGSGSPSGRYYGVGIEGGLNDENPGTGLAIRDVEWLYCEGLTGGGYYSANREHRFWVYPRPGTGCGQ